MRGFGQQKTLEAQKDRLISTFELAKKKSRAGDKGGCSQLDRYEVIIQSIDSYQLRSVCLAGQGISKTFTIPSLSNIEITDYTNQTTVFQPLTQTASSNCIIITDTKADSCYKLTVVESGIINDENKSGQLCSCN